MKPDFDTALDECLERTRRGESAEACAKAYPEYEGELLMLLRAASAVQQSPVPAARPEAYDAGRQRMLSAFAPQQNTQRIKKTGFNLPISAISLERVSRYTQPIGTLLKTLLFGQETYGMKLALRIAINLVVVVALVGAIAVNVSASSLPGDALYSIKRSWEQVRLGLTADPSARHELEDSLLDTRKNEVDRLITLKRQATVDISGIVTALEAPSITLGRVNVTTNAETQVTGSVSVGVKVDIEAQVAGDTLLALKVSVESEPESTPISEPTKAEQRTRTPEPTGMGHATETVEPTEAEQRTATAEPTEVKDDTRTPEPTEGKHATETPEPTEARKETQEPTQKPEATEPPSHTAESTEAQKPTAENTEDPHPTETPQPVSHLSYEK